MAFALACPSAPASPSGRATPEDARLPETEWSLVRQLADRCHPLFDERFATLVRSHWKPIYAYIRAIRPVSRYDAEDLTQEFLATVVTRFDFGKLSPERGSFRGYLKASLRNFLVTVERKQRAALGGGSHLPWNDDESTAQWDDEAHTAPPDETFDREWARHIAGVARARLRQDLIASGKARYFQIFEDYCLGADELTYDDVAALHAVKPSDVRNFLHYVRQRGRDILKDLVAEYLLAGESVEDEVKYLLSF